MEPISELILKRKREEIVAEDFTLKREERGNRPEAKQRFVEDGLPLMTQYAAISASSAPKSLRLFGDPFAARSDFEIGSNYAVGNLTAKK